VTSFAQVALAVSVGVGVYAYLGYPALLQLLRTLSGPRRGAPRAAGWPRISIVLPVYNGADVIARTLDGILALDYPADRRQILVVSDGSTDRTDDIVSSFADRGVELVRLARRQGKTAAENAARIHLTGDIVVNTDASVGLHPAAVKHLVAAFSDPSVGVASACDVSVVHLDDQSNVGEEAYVGYEMWVRDLETAVGGIVGASGCLYAILADLHMLPVPDALSRDFSAALTARRHGKRAVSVREALCFVPRGVSLRQEYQRKVRTVTRGLATLWHNGTLLNPVRYGGFAWMLFSHKVCRWLVPWALCAMLAALSALAVSAGWARGLLAAAAVLGVLAGLGWVWRGGERMPRLLALPAYFAAGNVAVLHAWVRMLAGRAAPVWEPTRRGA
jgi:glycosyltransferase involved in cell wall biosynthesis